MSTTWPVRDRLTMAACPMIRPCLQCVLPGRRDELRRVVADDSHERGREHLHQLPARSRSPQQQAEHVHLLVATRLVAEQFEQQRQLKPVLPSSRGRRRAVRTRHQRVCDIHATFHTRGRRRRTNDIANAPFWRLLPPSFPPPLPILFSVYRLSDVALSKYGTRVEGSLPTRN